MRYIHLIVLVVFTSCKFSNSQDLPLTSSVIAEEEKIANEIVVGAESLQLYFPQIKNKRCALVANASSLVMGSHLVDTLRQLEVNIVRVMVPEHGFRGTADAGEKIDDEVDSKTGIPILSLYGKNKKPKPHHLEGIDVVIFDLQDVGVRCYTYISTLHFVMEACAEEGVKVIVLDRPNPNGHYVDGPLMEEGHTSFVGMHKVPFVHGMTIAEYAKMINGEKWLKSGIQCDLEVVPCANYRRSMRYELPVRPSPNLPNYRSILLYPSLVFFEGTTVSVGRGTEMPFSCYGHPAWVDQDFEFNPSSRMGAKYPKHEGEVCFGHNLSALDTEGIRKGRSIDLSLFLNAYSISDQNAFWLENNFIDKLAGGPSLRKLITQKATEGEIRDTWKVGLSEFKKMRAKYLIYADE